MVRACDPAKSGDNLSIQRNERLRLAPEPGHALRFRWRSNQVAPSAVRRVAPAHRVPVHFAHATGADGRKDLDMTS